MVVVDTSVWIDFFAGRDNAESSRCAALIADDADVGLTDVVLTEVLQGYRSDREADLIERSLRRFPILRLETLDDFSAAAMLYRTARRSGITIRNTIDCLIAAPCIREGAAILHRDRDFDRLAGCSALQVVT